jgi:regulatory protein
VENRTTFRPRSRRMMTLELRQKGLDEEAIRSAVENVDDEASAYQAAQKRAVRFKGMEWNDFRKKISEFLARRGYSYTVIAPVVTRLWNEAHTDEQHFEEEDIE